MELTDKQFAMASLMVLGVGYFTIYQSKKLIDKTAVAVGDAAQVVGTAVNPLSTKNIVYRTVNAIGDIFDDGVDNGSYSLGSSTYDLVDKVKNYFGDGSQNKSLNDTNIKTGWAE